MREKAPDGRHVCTHCEINGKIIDHRNQFLLKLPSWVNEFCISSGMGKIEASSTLDKIRKELKDNLPKVTIKGLLEGRMPQNGFGIGGGTTGCGKTCAMAAILIQFLYANGTEQARYYLYVFEKFHLNFSFLWQSWPSAHATLRKTSQYDKALNDYIEKFIKADLLVLDDLGAEKVKGNIDEDFGVSQLELIIDARYREGKPIFYTTNLDTNEILAFYGARLVSRLCGPNPLAIVPGGADMRFDAQKKTKIQDL